MLHMEVFMQRLDNEHGIPVVTTTPTVSEFITNWMSSSFENTNSSFRKKIE